MIISDLVLDFTDQVTTDPDPGPAGQVNTYRDLDPDW